MKESTPLRKIGIEPKYREYFLEYASYVILDRAVPAMEDGLKPVQRRILHSLYEMDDGRYNKVANVVGHAMRYHPHGDASIKDALVSMGQKELLIDCQGNWGNLFTGDSAAAGRYIEARLTEFAKQILFSPRITTWLPSYDSRGQEPKHLPVKFPLLLALGTEGIAVGLSTKILPHNPREICDAAIKYLKGEKFTLLPDFPTGGLADFTDYDFGVQGSKVRVRAKINTLNAKTLQISEIPWETTTQSLVESIISAQEKGKVKIRKVEDNTAENVNIIVHISAGEDPDKVTAALYAFTDCEKLLHPAACVIGEGKPVFPSTLELLSASVDHTKGFLLAELGLDKQSAQEDILKRNLEIIFIQEKIYRKIETSEDFDEAKQTVLVSLQKFLKATNDSLNLHRQINMEDIEALLELKIRRIAKFDLNKTLKDIETSQKNLKRIEKDIREIVPTTIRHFEAVAKTLSTMKDSNNFVRKTQVARKALEVINKAAVSASNLKVYLDAKEGFIGTSTRIGNQAEFMFDASDAHKLFCVSEDGICKLVPIKDKVFVTKNIISIHKWIKGEPEQICTILYREGSKEQPLRLKRFSVNGMILEKDYPITKETKGSKVFFAMVSPIDEHPGKALVKFALKYKQDKTEQKIDLAGTEIKARTVQGSVVTAVGLEVSKASKVEPKS
jgi:topoisomerase IV subunit A